MPNQRTNNRVVKMLMGRVNLLASAALPVALFCVVAFLSLSDATEAKRDYDGDQALVVQAGRNLIEEKKSLILLALEEYCSNNPRECRRDYSNLVTPCVTLGDRLLCEPMTMLAAERLANTNNEPQSVNEMSLGATPRDSWMYKNRSSTPQSMSDELGRGQLWSPRLDTVTSERDIGTQLQQQQQHQQQQQQQTTKRRILDLLARNEQALIETAGTVPAWISEDTQKRPGVGVRLFKREPAQLGDNGITPNAYRVALEEANRLIKAHKRQQQSSLPPLTNSILFASPNLLSRHKPSDWQQNHQSLLEQKRAPNSKSRSSKSSNSSSSKSSRRKTSSSSDLLTVPKRTDSSVDMRPGSGIRRSGASISLRTSGHQLVQDSETKTSSTTTTTTSSTTTRPPDDESSGNNDDSMKCNIRRFTYKATKTNEAGSQCTGLVTASICYGGCDTGEIADWLFPHKKSIHKVCRHGDRIRRRVTLSYCTSSSGAQLEPDELGGLADYYYVDALNCVCKKCTSADTTCLGTMSTPHLQTLGEAVAELGQHQPSLASQLLVGADGGGD
uniref:Glycoprotein hormone beta-5 n=1 Tax=Aceria tosichella TaxID=561515 RepID=A0A6G1SNB4_9ACAR